MIITSDYGGFAGVRRRATHPPPASIRSSELMYLAQILPSTRTLFIGGRSAQKDQCGRNWSFHGSILPVFVFDDEIVIVVDLVPLGLLVVQVFQGVVDPVGVVLSELL